MKLQREAYNRGFTDGRANTWQIEKYYPLPKQVELRTVTLSDGTIVKGSVLPEWKPPFVKALTVEDAEKLVDLWHFPTETKTIEDAP